MRPRTVWPTAAAWLTPAAAGATTTAAYLTLAELVGLQVDHHPRLGWSTTTLSAGAHDCYAAQLQTLEVALAAHRQRRARRAPPPSSGRSLLGAGCACGRRIRASASTLAEGPIPCSLCGTRFSPDREVGWTLPRTTGSCLIT